ncbi:MAG: hypothetical protein ACR2RL_03885 [Gammaproteobacteria bacterium]
MSFVIGYIGLCVAFTAVYSVFGYLSASLARAPAQFRRNGLAERRNSAGALRLFTPSVLDAIALRAA